MRDYWERERPIELRPVDMKRYIARTPQELRAICSIRATREMPDDRALHEAVLAYTTDTTLLDTTLVAQRQERVYAVTCSRPRSTTRCGSTPRSRWTNGCSMPRRARSPAVAGGLPAARFGRTAA